MTQRSRDGLVVRGQGLVVSRAGRVILDRVDVDAEPGAVTVVTGASGAGKSTLLWVLAGLIDPDAGTITPADRFGRAAVVVVARRAAESGEGERRDEPEHDPLPHSVLLGLGC